MSFLTTKNTLILLLVITVLLLGLSRRPSDIKSYDREMEACNRSENKTICWKDLVTGVFERDGLDKAYDVIARLYETAPEFASDCHDFGHFLGKATYELFSKGKDFKVTPKTAFCSYGFYHGFLERLASEEGGVKRARDFCIYVDEQLARETPDVTLQCFHGVGHGWVNVHDVPELWGNEEGIVKRGLELCERVAGNDSELSRCATGVFNGIATFYGTGEYNLELKRDDPLWLCRKQTEKYKDPCYISMNGALVAAANGDLVRAAKFVDAIPEDEYAKHAMLNLAIPFGVENLNSSDHSKGILECRSLSPRLRIPCIQGYAFAFLESGKPEEEYIKPLDFCSSDSFLPEEKRGCLGYIFGYLAQWYPREKAYEICGLRPDDEKEFCIRSVEDSLKGVEALK